MNRPTRPSKVAFVQYTAEIGGSPISGLTVIDLLRQRGTTVDAIFGVAGPLEAEYARRGCSLSYVDHGQWLVGGAPLRRARRWLRELRSAWRFVRLFRSTKPDLVYVNTLKGVAAVAAARLLRIPAVWHIREQFEDVGGEMQWPLGGRPLVKSLVRRLPTQVVCISSAVQANVIGPEACPKARVIPNPLNSSFFQPLPARAGARHQLGLPSDRFIVGVPGTLRPVKGHEFFLDAAARLAAKHPDISFAVTGAWDHAYGDRLRNTTRALGIGDRVSFVGNLKDMCIFYAACDIVCVPSRAESFGRTIVETFSQGIPLVATRVGGIMETVTDGETGLLVNYGNTEELVQAIERLHSAPELGAALASAARHVACHRYREEAVQAQLAAVIETAGFTF